MIRLVPAGLRGATVSQLVSGMLAVRQRDVSHHFPMLHRPAGPAEVPQTVFDLMDDRCMRMREAAIRRNINTAGLRYDTRSNLRRRGSLEEKPSGDQPAITGQWAAASSRGESVRWAERRADDGQAAHYIKDKERQYCEVGVPTARRSGFSASPVQSRAMTTTRLRSASMRDRRGRPGGPPQGAGRCASSSGGCRMGAARYPGRS